MACRKLSCHLRLCEKDLIHIKVLTISVNPQNKYNPHHGLSLLHHCEMLLLSRSPQVLLYSLNSFITSCDEVLSSNDPAVLTIRLEGISDQGL